MAYHLRNCLILHVPKTGSDWERAACRAAVRSHIREIGEWHCDLQTSRTILRKSNRTPPIVGTVVRHPLNWYLSAWCYWQETGRFPREDGDPKIECDDFEEFVQNCMAAEPAGYVSNLYERFTGPPSDEVDFIGRQESLADDLVRLLRLAGEEFDEPRLRTTPPCNVRGSRSDNLFPGFTSSLKTKIVQHEHRALERFGYTEEPPPTNPASPIMDLHATTSDRSPCVTSGVGGVDSVRL